MRGLVVTTMVLLAGCPIPVRREAVYRPPMVVQVAAPDGAVAGAQVQVSRMSHPHSMYHETWEAPTDAAGEARFDEIREREWVMPLMMHGVPFYYWTVCVQAEGYEPWAVQWHEEGEVEMRVQLEPGAGRCPDPEARDRRLDRYTGP